MFRANMLMGKPLRLFGGIRQHALALIAQRQVNRGRHLLADRRVSFNLLADGFDRSMRTQESVGEGLIFAQKSQQQVLRLNVRRPELAGFVARKEYDAPGFLRVTFEHMPLPVGFAGGEGLWFGLKLRSNPWP